MRLRTFESFLSIQRFAMVAASGADDGIKRTNNISENRQYKKYCQ
jgi:hypothetical protein